MSKRVAIYARISDESEGAGLGVARQEKECRALCTRKRWNVVAAFSDNDISASSFSRKRRPGYEAMLRAVEAGEFDVIVCWHTDRLHRRPAELERFIDVINAARVDVHSVQAGELDLSTSDGRMVARITGAVAARESEHKSERIRSKMLELAEDGKVGGGGTRPFGFEDDRVTIRKEEAAHIKKAVRRVLDGDSFFAVMRDWNERGIVTPAGNAWVVTTLKRTLLTPRIAGLRQHQGVVIGEAVWPGIISEDDRALLVARARRRRHRKPHRYLLTGSIYTPDGAPVSAAGPSEHGVRRYKGKGVMIAAGPVEDEVAQRLIARLDTKLLSKAMARDARGADDDRGRALARQLAAAESAIARINDLYVEGLITKADAGRRRAPREAERDAIRRRMSTIDGARALPSSLPSAGDHVAAWWDAASLDDRRRLLDRFVERVVVNSARASGRHAEPAEKRVSVKWRR